MFSGKLSVVVHSNTRIMTSLQRVQDGNRWETNFTVEKPDKPHPNKVIKVNISKLY